ncbi:MAG: glutathione synthase [Saezia sp.]
MKILFVADPLGTFKTYKDSTFVMMREAAGRGHEIYACVPAEIFWKSGETVQAKVLEIKMNGQIGTHEREVQWYEVLSDRARALKDFDAVIMRKDPPFDSEFFYATHFLEQAQREGVKVFNVPAALRNHPEKMAVMEFPQYTPPTLITREDKHIRAFHEQYKDIILKPLDGMGGSGILRIKEDGMNLGSAIEMLTDNGKSTIMAQQYQPAIVKGDKRVLVIDGKPIPYALARIPQGNDIRGNLAAGAIGVAQPLAEEDRAIAEAVGARLALRGLLLIGLDFIGNRITEINVTSPTGFQEITNQTGFNVAGAFMDALEARLKAYY